MYYILLSIHSIVRWLLLAGLFYAIFKSCIGYFAQSVYSKTDNRIRHWTATIAHIQLMIGLLLYFQSPLIKYYWSNREQSLGSMDTTFFGLIHGSLMFVAVLLITIGSSVSKRKQTDPERYKTVLIWFSVALLIILFSIPWPFSPFASRPYIR